MNVRPAFANYLPAGPPPPLAQIIALMRESHARDLALSDEFSLAKSLQRRLDGGGLAGWPAYLDRLAQDSGEAKALLASLNIGYSEFFREPLAFAWLEQVILPGLMQQRGQAGLRVWSAGCAAGQEAWSIAILLDEQNAERGQPVPIRIFATDRVETLLTEAREGVYDAASVQQLRLKHLRRYFTVTGDVYRISPALKSCVDFSVFDLLAEGTTSPVAAIYGDFDLVFCCNLLFYYRPEVRQRILDKIVRALRPGGYCVTGAAEREIVARQTELYAVAPPAAVFQKRR
ncbi:MAG: protein-glutamate O-methyltransferase CheR [Sulfuritalea sp.]|nr:protein-glutamate O-methyltransferase CheR [Sulfuritalea sp.]